MSLPVVGGWNWKTLNISFNSTQPMICVLWFWVYDSFKAESQIANRLCYYRLGQLSVEYLQELSFCNLCNQWWKRGTSKANISPSKSEALFRVVCGHKNKISFDYLENCDFQFYFFTFFPVPKLIPRATRKDITDLVRNSAGILHLRFTLEQDNTE